MASPTSLDPRLTAHAIARARAEERLLPERLRLFDDPYAHLFDDASVVVDPVFAQVPFFREQVRLRTRFIDDTVRAAVERGVRHVAIVGAGFDTRALRMPELVAAGASVVEIDHASQIGLKRERLRAAGVTLPGHLAFVAADLGEPDLEATLPAALAAAGLPRSAPVLWVCEGLLGYLGRDTLGRLFRSLRAASGTGSTLIANHFVLVWSHETLAELLGPAGWTAGRAPGFDELHRRHIGPDVPPGSEHFAFTVATS